jgi:cytoskeletal protein RodZ
MSKKQFDHIENRIREAAENSEPPFDEMACSRMDALLNKEENKKRRFILWWWILPFLIIAGSTYFFINKNAEQKISAHQNNKYQTEIKSAQPENVPAVTPALTSNPGNANTSIHLNKNKKASTGKVVQNISNKENMVTTDIINASTKKNKGFAKGKLSSKRKSGAVAETNEGNVTDSVAADKTIFAATPVQQIPVDSRKDDSINTLVKNDSLKNSFVKTSTNNSSTKKIKGEKTSRFYLLASLGADAGNVKLLSFKNNKVTAKYGVGIGYQLNKKLSVQTDFYAGRKKYIAGPADYNAKQGSYWNMVQIVKVDASCLVYDIPFTLRYTFLQKPTTAYFATAGVSSFIMKKEEYDYYYIRNTTPYESSWAYTGNKNYFAVFNLSAGIEKKLCPDFSILAEPSVSIPISGVGDGRVKLYSTALQLSVKYQLPRKHK